MRFAWNRATAEKAATAPTDATAPATEPAAIELLLEGGAREVGWIDTAGQRTSDWLNASHQVPVTGRVPIEGAAPAADGPPAGPPQPIGRDRIVWVVPPPLPPNRHLRLHRRRVLVHLELDGYEVSGQAHVRPGADAVDQVLRGTRDFVPLTEVQVVARDEPSSGASLPVLIVNRRHVRRLLEDTPHASEAVPEPVAPDGAELDPRIALLVPPREPADAEEGVGPMAEAVAPADPSATDVLLEALTLLLDVGAVDIAEFQSIRARLPHRPA